MLAFGNRDMETCGFRDILFALKLPKAITLGDSQISRLLQYHSPKGEENGRVSLGTLF